MTASTRSTDIHAERESITRRRFINAGFTLAGAAGVAAATAGILGVGTPPTYLQAPIVEKPFTPQDPDTYTATEPDPYQPGTPQMLGPMELAIPSLNIRAALISVELEPGTNNMEIPPAENVGHYTPAAPIGAPTGSTLLAGHVNKGMAPGALWNLSKAQKGAPIYITNHTGQQFTYTINSARTTPRQPLTEDTYRTNGTPQLVIVTCAKAPTADSDVLNFPDNTIITAAPQAPHAP